MVKGNVYSIDTKTKVKKVKEIEVVSVAYQPVKVPSLRKIFEYLVANGADPEDLKEEF